MFCFNMKLETMFRARLIFTLITWICYTLKKYFICKCYTLKTLDLMDMLIVTPKLIFQTQIWFSIFTSMKRKR